MWTRLEFKANAKIALSRYYWVAVAVCLINSVISSAFVSVYNFVNIIGTTIIEISQNSYGQASQGTFNYLLVFLYIVCIIFAIFVATPLSVGLSRYFMESRTQRSDIGTLFYAFKNGRYSKILKVTFIWTIKIFLWSLLLIIPGIIKTYEYCFVPYILAENPDLETKRYFEISKAMTNNEKAKIFVMWLSFIGWILLGMLLCGIGTIFVVPYFYATYAEMYAFMRAKAFAYNFATPEELPDFLPQQFF